MRNEKETKKYLNELKEICDLYKFVEEFTWYRQRIRVLFDVLFPFFEEKINADINLIITDNNI